MAGPSSVKSVLKRLLLGGETAPQQVTVAIREPQDEIAVWLQGAGGLRDVTHLHSIACASPFTVCLSFGSMEEIRKEYGGRKVSLVVRERAGARRLLGRVGLRFDSAIQAGERYLGLFRAKSCVSYGLSKTRFWAHYVQQAYWSWRDKRVPNVRMSQIDAHAMMVMFLCPRPVVLVTTVEEQGGNMFPMNLMGALGDGYFSFALNSERQASGCAKRAGRVALSGIPFAEAGVARQLGKHHLKQTIDWSELPFGVKRSSRFGVPVPEFAARVKEVEVEAVKELGSHTFFVGRIVQEEIFADGPQFFMVHGMYRRARVV